MFALREKQKRKRTEGMERETKGKETERKQRRKTETYRCVWISSAMRASDR